MKGQELFQKNAIQNGLENNKLFNKLIKIYAPTERNLMTESKAVMLPRNIKPENYYIELTPDLGKFTFTGEVSIKIQILQQSSDITLNASELDIHECTLTRESGLNSKPINTNLDDKSETVTFEFAEPNKTGPATLKIRFTGELNDRLRGFYRSKYTDVNGNQKYIATTQFEATDARRAFPCWDEPSLKATFEVCLIIPETLVAVSNTMIAQESKVTNGLKQIIFKETPKMSTYLLAFVIGDLRSVEKVAPNGTLIRVWSTAGKENQGEFALETPVKLLAYFNEYFGTAYPLEKLDHIAIPDFAAGAMENWGAVTYREIALLVDPSQTSVQARQRVASIISHEMAHMWFGDLVTMAWWNDLWLNESFASWIGDKAVDSIYPEWEMWTQFVSSDTNTALSLDGLKNSHPIEQKVNDPAEIGQLFDAISYSKGGSILRMLEHFLGEETFRDGLRSYISKHQYGNAVTEDLWNALSANSNANVSKIMNTWVQQTGYPVIDVDDNEHDDQSSFHISQQRFVYQNLIYPEKNDETLWQIPVSILTANNDGIKSSLIKDRQNKISNQLTTASSWAKFNPEQVGFFRVNYSKSGWANLESPIKNLQLSPIDRLGLQNDAFALSMAGFLPVTQFLNLSESYINETNAIVWEDISANLNRLDSLVATQPFHEEFKKLVKSIYKSIGQKVGWDPEPGESELDSLMRATVLGQLGKYGDKDTLSKSKSLFSEYQTNPEAINPDLRGVVFNLAAQQGDDLIYKTIWDLHDRSKSEEEKVRLLRSLGSFTQNQILENTLEKSLSDSVRYHDTILVILSVAGNTNGIDLAWQFVKDNWDELIRRYGDGMFALSRLVNLTSRFTTQEKFDEVEGFFKKHPAPAADRAINQSLEIIRLNIAWIDKNFQSLQTYLMEK